MQCDLLLRWLLSKGRTEEARAVVEKISRENKNVVPKSLYDAISNFDDKNGERSDLQQQEQKKDAPRIANLFKPKELMFR